MKAVSDEEKNALGEEKKRIKAGSSISLIKTSKFFVEAREYHNRYFFYPP
jgi:hypothetical protein